MGYTLNLDVSKLMKGGCFDADIRPFWLSDSEIALSREDPDSYDGPRELRSYDIFIFNIATNSLQLIHKKLTPEPVFIQKRGDTVMIETKLHIIVWDLASLRNDLSSHLPYIYNRNNGSELRTATIADGGGILQANGNIRLYINGVRKTYANAPRSFSFYDNGCIVLVSGLNIQVCKNNNGNIAVSHYSVIGDKLGSVTNERTKYYYLSDKFLQEISADGVSNHAIITINQSDGSAQIITHDLPPLTCLQHGLFFEPPRFRIDYYNDMNNRWSSTPSLFTIDNESPVELYETHLISRKRNFDICNNVLALFTGMLQLRNWPLFKHYWRNVPRVEQVLRGQLIRVFRDLRGLPVPIVQIIFALVRP